MSGKVLINSRAEGVIFHKDSPAGSRIEQCVCVCMIGGMCREHSGVLTGHWAAYKAPACNDRSPVIPKRYGSRSNPVCDVTGTFNKEMEDGV